MQSWNQYDPDNMSQGHVLAYAFFSVIQRECNKFATLKILIGLCYRIA